MSAMTVRKSGSCVKRSTLAFTGVCTHWTWSTDSKTPVRHCWHLVKCEEMSIILKEKCIKSWILMRNAEITSHLFFINVFWSPHFMWQSHGYYMEALRLRNKARSAYRWSDWASFSGKQQCQLVQSPPLSRLLSKRQNADGSAVRIPSLPSSGVQTRSFHAEHKRLLSLRVRGNIHGGEESHFAKAFWPRRWWAGKHSKQTHKQACGFEDVASRPVSLPCQWSQQYQPASCATQP